MVTKTLNVQFQKSGSGSMTTKISLPITWFREMGVSSDSRSVSVSYDGKNIIIKSLNDDE